MQNTTQNQQPKSTTGQDATQNKGQQGQSFDKNQSSDKNQASNQNKGASQNASNQNASSQSPSSSKVGSNTQKDEPRSSQSGSMKNDASEGSVRKASNA